MKKSVNSTSRREFLTKSALAATGLALNSHAFSLSDYKSISGTNEKIPMGFDRKIHIFSKALQWLDYDGLADILVESGAEGVDFTVRPGGHILPENVEADLPSAVKAARKRNLRVDMITTAITSVNEKYTETILRTASSLGINFYRLGYLDYDYKLGIIETLQKLKPEFDKLGEMNRKYSIHGAYQNHSGVRVGGSVWDLYELVKDLDPQYTGCQYDVRHAVVEGANSWINGLKLIAPWIRCTDIKDFKWSQTNGRWITESLSLGEGSVDFDEYFKIVKELNIPGPMSIHLEYPPFEGNKVQLSDKEKRKQFIAGMRKDIDTLKSYISRYDL